MPIRSGQAVKMMTASVFAAAALLCASPAAFAEGGGGIPNPEPVPVPAETSAAGGQGECQAGESVDAANGNCVPTMTPIATGGDDAPVAPDPTTGTGDVTSSTATGVGADLVPNINGDPCSGYWESDVCLAENAPAVQPRSTLSTSP